MQPHILHVSADFPDPVEGGKTPVIRSLLELTRDRFRHEVVSINRRSVPPAGFAWAAVRTLGKPPLLVDREPFEPGEAITYSAPGRGIFHETMLRQLGNWLAAEFGGDARPDLIVGHKLSVEGIAVARAAELLGVPYALSIQGNTDTRIVAARPDLAGRFGRILREAAVVFPFAPWALQKIEARLGKRDGPVRMLPCPTELDQPLAPRKGSGELLSVFHLKNWRLKNLKAVVEAMRRLEIGPAGTAPALTVIGGGGAADMEACKSLAHGTQQLTFGGPLGREELRHRMNGATGLVMPSLRESFGLVFIEALFAGLPIIYPKGAAVDGYFDDAPFALRVDARDPAAIAGAMSHLVENESAMKAALLEWQESPAAQRFTRSNIADVFATGLELALGRQTEMISGIRS